MPKPAVPDSIENEVRCLLFQMHADVARFEVTGNAVFLWDALALLTAPRVAGAAIRLPDELRAYLHDAAVGIHGAAVRPPENFTKDVLAALKLESGVSGASVARDYAKHQSVGGLLMAYVEVRQRHGAKKAEELMAGAITPESMRARLTAARKTVRAISTRLGHPIRQPEPDPRNQNVPDPFFLSIVKGMPDVIWARIDKEKRRSMSSRKRKPSASSAGKNRNSS